MAAITAFPKPRAFAVVSPDHDDRLSLQLIFLIAAGTVIKKCSEIGGILGALADGKCTVDGAGCVCSEIVAVDNRLCENFADGPWFLKCWPGAKVTNIMRGRGVYLFAGMYFSEIGNKMEIYVANDSAICLNTSPCITAGAGCLCGVIEGV